ncbi:questin oxidase family protein, partial [Aliivibrio fischeri]|uniref:questin oxidase family protein n=1 Tax=Aliivibrio fischeri TaxID=668 RepID=UPI001C02EB82
RVMQALCYWFYRIKQGGFMLNQLLERAQCYDIETKVEGITNHLPMALIALDRLGATPERLDEYFLSYSEKLKPFQYSVYDQDFNWLEHLGDKDKFNVYLSFYSDQISLFGIKLALGKYINRLIQGCAASAFHALIRLSYGIIQENHKEIAFGLAHMSSHFMPLPVPMQVNTKPESVINHALRAFSKYVAVGDSVTKRITDISTKPEYSSVNYYPAGLTLRACSKLFSKLYLQSHDFTVLHTVTSCHAMRVLLPYIDDKDTALKSYWSASLVAILSIKDLKFNLIIKGEYLGNLDVQAVINSNDDHTIKLVFSCIEEYKHYNDVNYLKILSSKLKA